MSPSSSGILRLVAANCGRKLNISKKSRATGRKREGAGEKKQKKEIRWTKESIRLDWTLMKHDFYTRAQTNQLERTELSIDLHSCWTTR